MSKERNLVGVGLKVESFSGNLTLPPEIHFQETPTGELVTETVVFSSEKFNDISPNVPTSHPEFNYFPPSCTTFSSNFSDFRSQKTRKLSEINKVKEIPLSWHIALMLSPCVVVLVPEIFVFVGAEGSSSSFLRCSRLNLKATYQHCEFLCRQLGSQRVDGAVDAVELLADARLTVGFVERDGFGNVELTRGEILNGCLGCDVFAGRRRIHQVDKLLYCLQHERKACLLFLCINRCGNCQPSTIS